VGPHTAGRTWPLEPDFEPLELLGHLFEDESVPRPAVALGVRRLQLARKLLQKLLQEIEQRP
jgi:hypothetical protein